MEPIMSCTSRSARQLFNTKHQRIYRAFQSSPSLVYKRWLSSSIVRKSTTLDRSSGRRGPPRTATSAQALANRMYQKGETLLYVAPKTPAYTIQAWLLGGAAIFSGQLLWQADYWRDPQLAFFVPVGFNMSIVMLVGMGLIAFYRTGGQVKRIDLVRQVVNNKPGQVHVQTTLRRLLPFLKPHKEVSTIEQFILPASKVTFSSGLGSLSAEGHQNGNFFQRFSQTFWRWSLNFRRVFTNEEFLITTINDYKGYKIDYLGEFPQGLEKLMSIVRQERL